MRGRKRADHLGGGEGTEVRGQKTEGKRAELEWAVRGQGRKQEVKGRDFI